MLFVGAFCQGPRFFFVVCVSPFFRSLWVNSFGRLYTGFFFPLPSASMWCRRFVPCFWGKLLSYQDESYHLSYTIYTARSNKQ